MSELVAQDKLRLNVLLRQNLQALRIDEGRMVIHALTEKGDKQIQLNPDIRPEKYVRLVKQLISGYVLDSPEGYPIYISRWTRMRDAQANNRNTQSMEKLLLLGEPEAVMATVFSSKLTPELARRAWWCNPDSLSARQMLVNPLVVNSQMGKTLAEHLVEFIPFEESQSAIAESVQLILQPGLLNEESRLSLWKRSQRKNAFLAGFIMAGPQAMPHDHSEPQDLSTADSLSDNQNRLLSMCLSPVGKNYFKSAFKVFDKITDQDVTVMLLNSFGHFAKSFRLSADQPRSFEDIDSLFNSHWSNTTFKDLSAQQADLTKILVKLAWVSEALVDPIFGHCDSVGTVMRKKITPITQPLKQLFNDASQQPS